MEKHKAHLRQLKDYKETLAKERRDNAIKEKENQRILVKKKDMLNYRSEDLDSTQKFFFFFF